MPIDANIRQNTLDPKLPQFLHENKNISNLKLNINTLIHKQILLCINKA